MKKKRFVYIFAMVLLFALSACGAIRDRITSGGFAGFSQFAAIELGAYIDDVLDMFGEPDSTHTRQDSPGVEVITKSWNRPLSWEAAIFTNGYATGLMSISDEDLSNISEEEFNQISIGMSESEVFEILGVPNSVQVSAEPARLLVVVVWRGENSDARGSAMFTDGLVSEIGDFN